MAKSIDFVKIERPPREKDEEGDLMMRMLQEDRDTYRLFERLNAYEMHTNFKITRDVQNTIEGVGGVGGVDGVEALRTVTPYRSIIAFAKSFDEEEVKQDICKTLQDSFRRAPEGNIARILGSMFGGGRDPV